MEYISSVIFLSVVVTMMAGSDVCVSVCVPYSTDAIFNYNLSNTALLADKLLSKAIEFGLIQLFVLKIVYYECSSLFHF